VKTSNITLFNVNYEVFCFERKNIPTEVELKSDINKYVIDITYLYCTYNMAGIKYLLQPIQRRIQPELSEDILDARFQNLVQPAKGGACTE
jgi:hypothetical protein